MAFGSDPRSDEVDAGSDDHVGDAGAAADARTARVDGETDPHRDDDETDPHCVDEGDPRGGDASARAGPHDGLDDRADLGLLAGVAALLTAVHFLAPPALRARLAFDYVAFDPLTLFTSAYVHASDVHLYGNLLGYAIGSVYAYGVCVRGNRRPWFRRTAVALFVVVPVAVNVVSYVALSVQFPDARPVSRGFSGVVGGFAGFLLVALFVTLRERAGVEAALGALVAVALAGVGSLALTNGADPTAVGLLGVGVALAGVGLGARVTDPAGTGAALWERRVDALEVAMVALVVALLVRSLFPATGASTGLADESVFAHAAGVGFGVLAALLTRRDRR